MKTRPLNPKGCWTLPTPPPWDFALQYSALNSQMLYNHINCQYCSKPHQNPFTTRQNSSQRSCTHPLSMRQHIAGNWWQISSLSIAQELRTTSDDSQSLQNRPGKPVTNCPTNTNHRPPGLASSHNEQTSTFIWITAKVLELWRGDPTTKVTLHCPLQPWFDFTTRGILCRWCMWLVIYSIPMELTPTRTRIILFQTLVTYKPRESTYIVIFSAPLHHILSIPCCPCIYYSLLATLVIALSDFKFFCSTE